METKVKLLLTEKYNYDFDSEFFTDEMINLVDEVIATTLEVINPKIKPIEERKCKLDHKALKKIHKYNYCFSCGFNLENYT